jgi:hypothetical protein
MNIERSTHVTTQLLSDINNRIFFVVAWQICENNKSFPLDMVLLFLLAAVIYPSPPIFIFGERSIQKMRERGNEGERNRKRGQKSRDKAHCMTRMRKGGRFGGYRT